MRRKNQRARFAPRARLAILAAAVLAGASHPLARADVTLIPDTWNGIVSSTINSIDWSDSALWSAGVPNDDAVNKYVLNMQNIPANLISLSTPYTVYSISNINSITVNQSALTVESTVSPGGTFYVTGGSLTLESVAATTFPLLVASAGGAIHVSATSEIMNYAASRTYFSSDGTGTVLDLHSLQSITYGAGGAAWADTINASNGGTVDLSGLTSINRAGTPEDDVLVFQASAGGVIKLDNLASINADVYGTFGYTQTRFNMGTNNLSLPALTIAKLTDFNIAAGGTISVPLLQRLDNSTIELAAGTSFTAPALVDIGGITGVTNGTTVTLVAGSTFSAPALVSAFNATINAVAGSTFNAPNLTNVSSASITIPAGATFNTGILSQINAAEFFVSGGAVFNKVSATSDLINIGASATIFSSDGAGTVLDLHTLQSITYGAGGNAWGYTVNASNGGTIDLSGLTSINRAGTPEDDVLVFQASAGGVIKLNNLASINADVFGAYSYTQTRFNIGANSTVQMGNIQSLRFAAFNITDPTGRIVANSLNIGSGSSVSLAPGSTLQITGNFTHSITSSSNFTASGATLKMTGNGLQYLEIAGKDSGDANPGNNGNFGFGQLSVGSGAQATVVQLQDSFDNGNRGPQGQAEALYLFGLPGSGGLVLNGGSDLLIGNFNVYTYQDGNWISLQALIGPDSNGVPFDYNGGTGFVARFSVPVHWSNPGSDSWNVGGNWDTSLVPSTLNDVTINPNAALTVSGPTVATNIHSLTIDTNVSAGITSLNLNGSANFSVGTFIQVGTHGELNVNAGTLSAGQLNVLGNYLQAASASSSFGPVTNNGTISSAGNLAIGGTFTNNGTYSQTGGVGTFASVQGTGSMIVAPGAAIISDHITVNSLAVNGLYTLRANGSVGSGSKVQALAIANSSGNFTGKIDITNNGLVVEASDSTDKASDITLLMAAAQSGRNGPAGAWTGTGITSSALATDAAEGTNNSFHTTLAIVDNGAYPTGTGFTSFAGEPVDANSIIVTRALVGDANLDGTVNNSDLVSLLTHFGLSSQTQATGDFNDDGNVDNTDLVALLTDYTQSLPGGFGLAPAGGSPFGTLAPVPEPISAAGLLAGAALLFLRRTRRQGRKTLAH